MKPSSESATQITESVPEASAAARARAGEGRRRRQAERQGIVAAEDQRLFADHRRLQPAQAGLRAYVVEAHAGVFGLEIDARLKADALIGGEKSAVVTACTPPRLPLETPSRSPVVFMPVIARQLA